METYFDYLYYITTNLIYAHFITIVYICVIYLFMYA